MEHSGRRWIEERHIGRRRMDHLVREQNSHYKQLFYLGQVITSETNIDKLFDTVVDQINHIMSATRSTVFVYDGDHQELWSLVGTGIEKSMIRIPSDSGIAGWVFQNKEPAIVSNAYDDDRFNPSVDLSTGFSTENIICVPLINRQNHCLGSLEVLNKTTLSFDEDDLAILNAASNYITIALENATLIDEMQKKEKALSESEEKYRTIIQSIVDGYFEVDLEGNLTFFNDSMRRILAYPEAEMIGLNNRTFMTPETSKRVYETFNKVYRTGEPTKAFGWELIRKDGEVRDVETSVSLIRAPQGTPAGFRGIARDITELRAFEKAKERVINHLSHELGTPLYIIDASVDRMTRELKQGNTAKADNIKSRIKRSVVRLKELQDNIDDIIRGKSAQIKENVLGILEFTLTVLEEMEGKKPLYTQEDLVKNVIDKLDEILAHNEPSIKDIWIDVFLKETCDEALKLATTRDIHIVQHVQKGIRIRMDPAVLKKVCSGILKNAIENTPDEGLIEVRSRSEGDWAALEFADFGVGISQQNQKMIFGGFFHTQDTHRYSSKMPYLFNAGGWGADLLRTKVLSERFGFSIDFTSRRCRHLPLDTDECPGKISACPFVHDEDACLRSGGTTFYLHFPLAPAGS